MSSIIDTLSNNHNGRPRSAAESGRLQSQSIGRFFQSQSNIIDEKTVSMIWKGFGSYIAKQLRNGKGVFVPKFGNFTFTPTLVDLAGTTNPGERDKQFRDPVFLVGKDFVSGVPLRTGMAHNKGAQVRPYDIKGASGIIPKVKINYTEVSALCGQSKDTCKNGCEQVFRFLSDKVRKGDPAVSMEIPFVGQFIVRTGIAAISFIDDLYEETKGVTAKNHFVNKLFSSSVNRLNLQIHDQNQVKSNPNMGLGGALRVTGDAESWLKSNLNISVQDMVLKQHEAQPARLMSANPAKGMTRYGSMKPQDLKRKSWAINGGLTEHNKHMFDKMSEHQSTNVKRPMSAVTRITQNSRMTNLPEVGRMKLMIIANDIYRNRSSITDILQASNVSLRDLMSSSEIQSYFKKSGLFIEIGHIKALLKEFGFQWNGKSCSFVALFQKCQEYLYGATQEEENSKTFFQTVGAPQTNGGFNNFVQGFKGTRAAVEESAKRAEELIAQIKDVFYASGHSIYEIFQEARLGQMVDASGLIKVVQQFTKSLSEQDIDQVFSYISRGRDSISYQDFAQVFKWDLPAGSDWETTCIRSIREWMFKQGLSSDTIFELFLKKANKIIQRRLTRLDFHKALNECNFKFTAAEIDGLFKTLDVNQDGELDVEEWRSRIYEDSLNPLQMLRDVVQTNRLTPDDILFKMQVRIWDAPLDYPKLCDCLRRLDSSLSDGQIRHLAKTLKNKDNKVDIHALVRNLTGQEYETVDYRNRIFRQLYSEIHPHKSQKLISYLEEVDPSNDGRVEANGLKQALRKVGVSIEDEALDRFIRFLDKDTSGKIRYMDFMNRMGEVSNRDHNPFRSVVQRLAYFIESNSQTVQSVLKRLAQKSGTSSDLLSVPVEIFAKFLKAKIDKKRSQEELNKYAYFMDIDKDGLITEIDLKTCIDNLNSDAFYKNSGEALATTTFSAAKKFYPTQDQMSEERAIEIAKQIRTALINQRIAYKEAFNRFDGNKDGFLSFTEFSQGIDKILTLSVPVKEKIFALMDKNKIGLVDYPNFLEVIELSSANRLKKGDFSDNFDWENGIIEKIKKWILSEKITVEEAFKCFDKDFDGHVRKEDLRWGIINILKVKEDEIFPTKIDRLFRLMDFYKTNSIQLSDFQRLLHNENPYSAQSGRMQSASTDFRRSFGGGFAQTSTFDWKLSAIQQIGLLISKKYQSVQESFEIASERLQKMTFQQFKKFVEQTHALNGFNMTLPLVQKLFAELDPHKKGYLSENDWINAFSAFNHSDQLMIELKNTIQCSFANCDSAFQFFLTFNKGEKKTIGHNDFVLALESLSAGRFKTGEINLLWKHLTRDGQLKTVDRFQFRNHFDSLPYNGNSTLRQVKTAPPGARTTIVSQSSSTSQWESDIFEKLRQIIRSSSLSLSEIFSQYDTSGNGVISQQEFRNALRKLNLGLTSREIDKLMTRIDTNQDGKIDWKEFQAKFKSSELDERLKERAKDKMARLKELMILHMTSPIDAFRFFDESKLGKLTYQEFAKLVIKAYELSNEKVPAYPVIKDLFDTIDIRKDGILDLNEWMQTFVHVTEGNNKLTIKSTPLNLWENGREYAAVGTLIAKNRRLLKEEFERVLGQQKPALVTYDQARAALLPFLQQHFNSLGEDKLKIILRVAEMQGANVEGLGNHYDYMRLLDVYKGRHAGPQL